MIDTIHLGLKNWTVKPGADLEVNTGNMNYRTGEVRQTLLFKNTSGKETYGARAYFNKEKLGLTIKPYAGKPGAFVNFSAPNRINTDNYYPMKESQLSEVFEGVENELLENGIETDIQEAKLIRVDTFKNILTDEETECYSRIFGLLKANRAKNKNTYGVTGWLMGNKSTQYCVYDKILEMRKSGHLTEGLKKTLRFEYRSLKSPSVKNFFKMDQTTVKELKAYGWNAIRSRTIKAWKDNFFKYEIEDFEIIVESQLRNEMEFYQAKYGRNFFSKYLKAYGAYFLASSSGGVEVIKKALQNMNMDRLKIYRAERVLTETLVEVQSLRNDSKSPQTLGELYSELKYKMEKVEA